MMIDPRQGMQMIQGGMGGGQMNGPQIPQQIMPPQAPQGMQTGDPNGMGMMPQGMMQDPRVLAYLRALQGGR